MWSHTHSTSIKSYQIDLKIVLGDHCDLGFRGLTSLWHFDFVAPRRLRVGVGGLSSCLDFRAGLLDVRLQGLRFGEYGLNVGLHKKLPEVDRKFLSHGA